MPRAFSIWIEYLSSAVGLGTNVERGLIFMSRHHTTSKSIRCNVCNVVPRQINQSSHANYWQGSLERIWHSSLPPSLEGMPFVKNNYKHTKIWLFFSSVSATWNPRLVCLECVSLETTISSLRDICRIDPFSFPFQTTWYTHGNCSLFFHKISLHLHVHKITFERSFSLE